MRYVVILLVGAFVGAMLTVITLNALRQGTAVPNGVMAVMQYHINSIRTDVAAQRCSDAEPHFQTLRALANDIEPVFLPTGSDDVLFARYAGQMRNRLDEALKSGASECRVLTEQLGRVGDGCKACHRDFK